MPPVRKGRRSLPPTAIRPVERASRRGDAVGAGELIAGAILPILPGVIERGAGVGRHRKKDETILWAMRRNGAAPPGRSAGFTLLEILVVLVILGLLAAVIAGPQVFRQLGAAKSEAAKLQLERVSGALDLYRLDVGRYPSQQEGLRGLVEPPVGVARWNGPYLKKQESLVDPWGRPYAYRIPGQHGEYDLWSLGADGIEGGEGENRDVVSW